MTASIQPGDELGEVEKIVPFMTAVSSSVDKSTVSKNLDFLNNNQTTEKDSNATVCLASENGEQKLHKDTTAPSTPERNSRLCGQTPDDIGKRGILKNFIVVSVVFVLMFTAYGSLATLQSSLHLQQGMGVINQAVLYAVMAVSCLLLPKIVIRFLGHKWSLTVSLIGYVLWMGANGYGVWGTMLPASVILGACAAVLWTTHGSYFSILAKHYAFKTKQDPAAVTSLFFGIFVALLATSSIIGSVISSTILRPSSVANETYDEDLKLGEFCGLNDCPGTNLSRTHLSHPPSDVVWTLVGVDIAMGTVAVVICCIFVDPLPPSWIPDFTSSSKNLRQVTSASLLATMKHIGRMEQLLLIPITMYTGMQYAFLDAEYTKSFISCFLAIWMVGWCLLPSAICRVLGSVVSGRVAKYTGLIPIFIYSVVIDVSYQLTLLLWSPSEGQLAAFIIVPCLSTLADAVWHPQIKALYGVLFSEDTAAAFSAFQFFSACGTILVFAYSSFLCTRIKLYIYTSIFALGVILLFVLIFVFLRPRKSKPAEDKS